MDYGSLIKGAGQAIENAFMDIDKMIEEAENSLKNKL